MIQTYFKAKNNILQIFKIDETKFSVTCVYKQYEVKNEIGTAATTTAKYEVFVGL